MIPIKNVHAPKAAYHAENNEHFLADSNSLPQLDDTDATTYTDMSAASLPASLRTSPAASFKFSPAPASFKFSPAPASIKFSPAASTMPSPATSSLNFSHVATTTSSRVASSAAPSSGFSLEPRPANSFKSNPKQLGNKDAMDSDAGMAVHNADTTPRDADKDNREKVFPDEALEQFATLSLGLRLIGFESSSPEEENYYEKCEYFQKYFMMSPRQVNLEYERSGFDSPGRFLEVIHEMRNAKALNVELFAPSTTTQMAGSPPPEAASTAPDNLSEPSSMNWEITEEVLPRTEEESEPSQEVNNNTTSPTAPDDPSQNQSNENTEIMQMKPSQKDIIDALTSYQILAHAMLAILNACMLCVAEPKSIVAILALSFAVILTVARVQTMPIQFIPEKSE